MDYIAEEAARLQAENDLWLRFNETDWVERSLPHSDVPLGRTYRLGLGMIGSMRQREGWSSPELEERAARE